METLLAKVVLSYGGEDRDVADLVLVGLLTGEWQALAGVAARGLGLQADRTERAGDAEFDRLLDGFRYERRLLAAAELNAWLSERSLRLDELEGVLERRWLRARFEGVSCRPASAQQVAAVMRAEAVCSGTFALCTDELLAWHAGCELVADAESERPSRAPTSAQSAQVEDLVELALEDSASGLPRLGEDELRRRAARLVALKIGYERFRACAVSEAAVDARLAERRLDWTVVTGNELSFELEGAARETRLHVVHDGRTLAQVAELLGFETKQRELELGSVPAGLSAELLSARVGDLVGPWIEDERWRVLELDARVEPGGRAAGERVRMRAREELLSELVERLSAGKGTVVAAF
ncbi:MAG: hypothetical protein ACYDHH_09415 [Solirubrobacteraceae bacterium]